MRILLASILIFGVSAHAAVCGLYQVEDFGDRITYTLTRFTPNQTVFNITNPGNPLVKNMIQGVCYCAEGIVQQDPEFYGDDFYQLLQITRLEGAPYTGCLPVEP